MAQLNISNITLTTDLNQKLNLISIYSTNKEIQYNPSKFPGIVLRLNDPKATLLLFKSGKVVCVGVKSVQEGKSAMQIGLKKLNIKYVALNICPQLFVGSVDLGFRIDLNKFYEAVNRKCFYEIEIFPALIYKRNGISVTLFSSGKLILTGAKFEYQLHRTYKIILSILENNCVY